MDALLGRCHNRTTTCLEPGTGIQPNQNYSAQFSVRFQGAVYGCTLETFLSYFTYSIVKIFGKYFKKNQYGFFSLASKGPLLLGYSRLQTLIIKFKSKSENWQM